MTQSVTRTRWLAAKVGLIGLVSIAVAGLVSLMITWWSSPLDRLTSAERDELRRLRREIRMLREDATLAAQGAL